LLRFWPILIIKKTEKYYSAKSSAVLLAKVPLLDAASCQAAETAIPAALFLTQYVVPVQAEKMLFVAFPQTSPSAAAPQSPLSGR
jgi:hypothetical protein